MVEELDFEIVDVDNGDCDVIADIVVVSLNSDIGAVLFVLNAINELDPEVAVATDDDSIGIELLIGIVIVDDETGDSDDCVVIVDIEVVAVNSDRGMVLLVLYVINVLDFEVAVAVDDDSIGIELLIGMVIVDEVVVVLPVVVTIDFVVFVAVISAVVVVGVVLVELV